MHSGVNSRIFTPFKQLSSHLSGQSYNNNMYLHTLEKYVESCSFYSKSMTYKHNLCYTNKLVNFLVLLIR